MIIYLELGASKADTTNEISTWKNSKYKIQYIFGCVNDKKIKGKMQAQSKNEVPAVAQHT
jgi:hypothetical protein